MAHVGILQQFWCETSGAFGQALEAAGHRLTTVPLFDGAPVPTADAFDGWLVMGGPMNTDQTDRFPFLTAERELLAELIESDQPVIGICLGAQLLARAAGAPVYAGPSKEIGLFPIELTAAAAADTLFSLLGNGREVFHWHGDTFDLPAGAVHLARSARFEHQAFRLGRRVYGLQFHLECTARIVSDLRQACGPELAALPREEAFERFEGRLESSLAEQNRIAHRVILEWVGLFD